MGVFLTRELPCELPAGLSAFQQTSACMGRFIDTMSFVIPRGRWCDIALNGHAPTVKKLM
jgi:hypothetical protein